MLCQENTTTLVLRYLVTSTSRTVSDNALMLAELCNFSQTLETSDYLTAYFYALINYKSNEILEYLFGSGTV